MRGRRQAYPNLGWGSNRQEGLWIRLDGGWLGCATYRQLFTGHVMKAGSS